MSKLHSIYLDFKKQNPDTLLLFKSGIFYLALDQDAIYLSELLNLKLTNLNNTVQKCGFPCNSLDKYLRLFKACNLNIKIIEIDKNTAYTLKDYEQNTAYLEILNLIKKVDINTLSIPEAYAFIENLKKKVDDIL